MCRYAPAKLLHDDITKTLDQWKRTKGKSGSPDPNLLVELATWFETNCTALGLDETQVGLYKVLCSVDK